MNIPNQLDSHLDALVKKAAAARADADKHDQEAARIQRLRVTFPDLNVRVGRWGKTALFSASVNGRVDAFDARHNCGCCQDSPLEIWPYLTTEDGPVYSDPPCFFVGQRVNGGDDRLDWNWREQLLDASLPVSLINKIAARYEKTWTEDSSDDD